MNVSSTTLAIMALESAMLEDLIVAQCPGHPVLRLRVEVFARLESTNRYLLETARETEEPSPRVCLALEQSAGRGRRGRAWLGRERDGLALSLAWPLPPGTQVPAAYPVGAGLALIHALESLGYTGIGLKWPNDLMVGTAKLAGILVEQRAPRGPEPGCLVVGLGVNLRGAAGLGLEREVTDLAALGVAEPPEPLPLAAAVTAAQWRLHETLMVRGLAPFREELERHDSLRGRSVEILDTGERVRAERIDPDSGCLCVRTEAGERRWLHSGEVSVRGRADA